MNDFTEHSTIITDRLRLMDQQRVGSDHHAYRFNTPHIQQNDFIEYATTITDRLRFLDKRRVVFGSNKHAYRFNAPLTQQQVDLFEAVHDLSLPIMYRRFLTELGNGGAGPFYGVLPLHSKLPELLQPFPYTQAATLSGDDEEVWDNPIPGAVTIANYGCGTYFLLVVKGESAGQVWVDNRYETGISPAAETSSQSFGFDNWWLNYMNEDLVRFERVLKLMEAATDHEEIHHQLEPEVLQLEVDLTMLSIMDRDPKALPRVNANKPWGQECGRVEECYGAWLKARCRASK